MPDKLQYLSSVEEKDFFHTYKRHNIVIERGEGCYLFTDKGEKILDMFGGLAVNILGYSHPQIISAIDEQIRRYIHLSNLFYQDKQIELAEKLLGISGMKKVFFCNSGTEASEAAIKLSRKYFKGTSKKTLISFSGSFHGRTMGALSLTSRMKYKEDFAPLLPDVLNIPFDSKEDLIKSVDENTAAVFLECMQGEGGVNEVSGAFIRELIELRNKLEFLIVADEIQSGIGRTGKFCSYEHYGLVPDIVLLAKGIGGGLPLGAVLGSERVENVFNYGDHGTTFGGNPVAASCGIVVIDELRNGLMENAERVGGHIKTRLNDPKMQYGSIKEVRGRGLMLGIEMNSDCKELVQKMIQSGVLVNVTNGNVVRLLPPLILNPDEADHFIEVFGEVITSTN